MTNIAEKGTRVAGHALTLTWSGEYGVESSSTGTCKCGKWEESASNQEEVRFEYRCHLGTVLANQKPKVCQDCGAEVEHYPGTGWVDVLSGDEGGTYDNCPRGIDAPHRPQ